MAGYQMIEAATAIFGRIAAARRRTRTQRVIESLPEYIRKDIGWSTDRMRPPSYIAH